MGVRLVGMEMNLYLENHWFQRFICKWVSGHFSRTFFVIAFLILSGCSSVSSSTGSSKLSRIKALPIGSDKAAILKEFGAPVRIEMIDKKLSYTYEKKQRSKVVSSVTLMFDDKNKVIAKAIH